MRFHFWCFLLTYALPTQAFTGSGYRATAQRSAVVRNPSQVRFAIAIEERQKNWVDLHEFNIELDQLAEKSGTFNQPVISRAAECEELWEAQTHCSDAKIKPDTVSFNTVLKAWNRCCNALSESSRSQKSLPNDRKHSVDVYTPRDAAKRATSLLLEQNKDESVKPDATSFNIVIGKCRDSWFNLVLDFSSRIFTILRLDTWAKSRLDEAPEAAERLLKLMLEEDDVEPDTLSYHGVLDAWAKSGREESPEKVKQIFNHMEGLHDQGKGVKTTIRTVNSILNAYAKRASYFNTYSNRDPVKAGQIAADALAFFEEIKKKSDESEDPEWKPDVATYTCIMDVCARVGSYKTTQRAEALLEELKQRFEATNNPRLRPNFRTYTALIMAWSRCRSDESPGRIEELLEEMNMNPATRANSRAYTSAIQCWGKSRDPLKAKRALKILRDMQTEHKKKGNDDVRPTILSYNAAIDACARCQGTMEQQTEAIKIAFAILKAIEVDDFVETNEVTYATLLRAVASLLPAGNERNQVASAVFEKARKNGLVEFNTITNLRKSVDAQVMLKLVGDIADKNGNFDYRDLPAAWTKNVN